MVFRKNRSKVVAAAVVVLLAAGGWLAFRPSQKAPPATTSTPATSQTTQPTSTTKGADPTKLVTIETADFKYAKPVGWAEISPKILDSTGAASGIGRPTEPVATFSVKVSTAVPKDNNDLKNSTLNELKKFTNFQLVSDVDAKIDGQAGQKFTYNFSDSSGKNKTTQQMSVVPYKQKTFFLLFSSAASSYDKQTGDFSAILSGFKFK